MALSLRRSRWLRLALAGVLIAIILLARPTWHVISTALWDTNNLAPTPPGFVDDASRLNETHVAEVWPVPAETAEAEKQLAALLKRAQQQGLKVSIAGARHSMGGHTIHPEGIVVDMLPFRRMTLGEASDVLTVQAGARWSEIIPYHDARGRSVAVMQSNSSFSVGGSLSVNCHGWQFGKPPIASTVESFRLMLADGQIVRCSRTENKELFSLVLGGYGLFGIILDAELQVVANERYRLEQRIVPVEEALATFNERIEGQADVAMAYARMGIAPSRFLDEVIINILRRAPAADGKIPPLAEPGLVELRRSLFRGSVGSNYGKELRWEAETRLQPHLSERHFSRNQLLSESVEIFQNRTAGTTDILHEYFVPAAGLVKFVVEMQRIVPRHKVDLLNVTVRSIDTDTDSFLRYADQPMFSFVMLCNQSRTPEAEAAMENVTRELIDAALANGGSYYLPYRLHATREQFERAYPQAEEFFDQKRKYDPDELFQNRFYEKYGKPAASSP
jgi:FAD/FMN-containing dehydrogenase